MKIKKWLTKIIGDSASFQFKYTIFHIFLIIGFFLSIHATIVNIFLKLPLLTCILPFLSGCSILFIFILSRVFKKFELAVLLLFILLVFIFSPLLWFTNAGINGGYQYYMILIGLFFSALYNSYKRIIAISIITAITISLIVIENFYPQIITNYHSQTERNFDVAINIVIIIIASSCLFIIYVNQYLAEHKRVIDYAQKLELLANTDDLTELYNHRYIFKALDDQIARFKRYNEKFSIFMFDIDDFKKINDLFGHQFGDTVLVTISKAIKKNLRKIDIIARYGGEEFLVISPHTDINGTYSLAKKICKLIGSLNFKKNLNVTVSGGVIEYNGEKSADFIKKADSLLYKAKSKGKNRIETGQ